MTLAMHCNQCGSTEVLGDAYAFWDEDSQQWSLNGEVFDKGASCDGECGGEETRIEEVDITNLPPHTALSLTAAWAEAEEV
jgi:hypothetical protein